MSSIVSYIEAAKRASGKSKQVILINAPKAVQEVFKYTYDDQKYGVVNIYQQTPGTAHLEDVPWTALLDKLAARKLTGRAAINATQTLLNQLTPADAKVLIGILQKNLRVGVGKKTITSVFPGLIDDWGVMLAKPFEDRFFTPDLLWSIKRDGVRAYYHRGDHVLYTRGKKELIGFEHIKDALYSLGHDFDGELEIPNMPFSKSCGLIRSNAACPTAVYYVFDIPSVKEPFKERYSCYKSACENLPDFIKPLKHVTYASIEQVYRTFDIVLTKGYEGLMAKTPHHLYQRKRLADWLKLKNEMSELCTIEGTFPGEGLCVGVGGIIVTNSKGVQIKVGTGLSEAQRLYLQNDPSAIGRKVTITFQEYTTDGSFRQPRMVTDSLPVDYLKKEALC